MKKEAPKQQEPLGVNWSASDSPPSPDSVLIEGSNPSIYYTTPTGTDWIALWHFCPTQEMWAALGSLKKAVSLNTLELDPPDFKAFCCGAHGRVVDGVMEQGSQE